MIVQVTAMVRRLGAIGAFYRRTFCYWCPAETDPKTEWYRRFGEDWEPHHFIAID